MLKAIIKFFVLKELLYFAIFIFGGMFALQWLFPDNVGIAQASFLGLFFIISMSASPIIIGFFYEHGEGRINWFTKICTAAFLVFNLFVLHILAVPSTTGLFIAMGARIPIFVGTIIFYTIYMLLFFIGMLGARGRRDWHKKEERMGQFTKWRFIKYMFGFITFFLFAIFMLLNELSTVDFIAALTSVIFFGFGGIIFAISAKTNISK
jgi:hypothetical protein